MKINSLFIASFGKLKNVKLDFADTLNIIYGDNEAGKTHIAEFIKVMFYGSGSRGQGVNNIRKKYKPWDGSKMGGHIDFTHENKRYRLERELKASNAADTVVLYDLDLGTSKTLSSSDNIGAKFFGISVSSFEQSVFIDNSVVFSGRGDDGELNLKLANLMASADEDVSYDKIIKNISDAKEQLISKNGKKGPIRELEAEIAALQDKLCESANIYRCAEQKAVELSLLEAKSADAANNKNRLFERLKAFELYSLKKRLIEFKNAVTVYEQTEQQLKLSSGDTADNAFLEDCETALKELKSKTALLDEKLHESEQATAEIAELAAALPTGDGFITALRDKKQSLSAELESADRTVTDTAAALSVLKTERSALKGKPNIALIIIGAVLICLGIAAGFYIRYLFPFAVVGLILAGIGLAVKSKPDFAQADLKITETENALSAAQAKKAELKQKITDTDGEINDYIVKTNTDNSLLASKKEAAVAKRTELIHLQENTEREKSAVLSAISSFKPVYDITSADAAIAELKALLSRLNEAKIRADIAVSHTGCRSTAEAFAKLDAMPEDIPEIDDTREELNEKFHSAGKLCSELSNQITAMNAEIKAMTSGVRTPAEYEREIKEREDKLASMREFTANADIAAEVLAEAYALQRRSFSGALENRALEIFAGLTDNSYSDMSVSKDFDINVKADGDITSHSVEYLSKGTIHQAYFALRLALSEFLSNDGGSLPVILDDIFSQYDNARTASGFRFLREYSKKNQVLFFTCHKELAEMKGANLITL